MLFKDQQNMLTSLLGKITVRSKSMATINCLVTNIFLNIFFCVQQMNETHTGLEQHDGE